MVGYSAVGNFLCDLHDQFTADPYQRSTDDHSRYFGDLDNIQTHAPLAWVVLEKLWDSTSSAGWEVG